MHVSGLFVYPVKGCQALPVETMTFDAFGPLDDRRWMVVDRQGTFLSQRDTPQLALLQATPRPAGAGPHSLTLQAPGQSPLTFDLGPHPQRLPKRQVAVHRDRLAATTAAAADAWLSEWLAKEVHLVYMGPDDERYKEVGKVSFCDGQPLLVVTQSSLRAFQSGPGDDPLRRTLPMSRFRPNIVVDDTPDGIGWSDDLWRELAVGAAALGWIKPCERCVVITIDQVTGKSTGTAILRDLLAAHAWSDKPIFGQMMWATKPEPIHMGDAVTVQVQALS